MSAIAGVIVIGEATTVMTTLQSRGLNGLAVAFGEAIRHYVDDEGDHAKAVVLLNEMKSLMEDVEC